jgi:peptidoglycan-associated lipoprotein
MKINKLILIFLIFVFTAPTLYAQRDIEKGYEFYNLGEWSASKDYLKNGYAKLKDKDQKAEVTFMIAECYRNMLNSKVAEGWYKKAIQRGYADPVAILYFADMLKMNESYDEALIEYKNYLVKVPSDERGEYGVASCEKAAVWKKNPTRYKVEAMAFFNDREADFAPAFAKKDYRVVYFTSSREGTLGNKVSQISGVNYYDIFETSLDRKGKWSVPTPIGPPVNSEWEEGGCSLNQKANQLYFSRCSEQKYKKLGCQIYLSVKKGQGWGDPERIPIAHDSIDIKFPSLSPDEKTLFFTAQIPGGYGGQDIWMIQRSKKTQGFGEPINLGPEINTFGNEWTPFCRDDSTLYFASDQHLGMGGMDIFKARLQPDGKWKVENMQYPINSAADDFGIIFQGDEEAGFFSSSRAGGKGSFDIYYFELPGLQFESKGFIVDKENGEPLPAAKIAIIGDNGFTLELDSEADGSYRFPKLKAGVDYTISASKDGYWLGKINFTTKGINENKTFDSNIALEKVIISKVYEIDDIFYDFNKATLRDESKVSLDKLVSLLEDNPRLTILIMSHTDCRGKDEANITLSNDRAASVVNYLIEKGIENGRLSSQGFGESQPFVVDEKLAALHPFLESGQTLTEAYINNIKSKDQQEIAHQVNRRTQFKVISADFESKLPPKTIEESDN